MESISSAPASNKIAAIASNKCPRCRRGPVFMYGAFNYLKFTSMHRECPVCNLHYEIEPGFFQGAMYTGYAISVAIVITCFVAIYVLGNNPETWVYISITVAVALMLAPINFRYSRLSFLHLFSGIKYEPGRW